ncbi:MAG: hypothetical protein ACP5G4_07785 [bacterium]
MNGRRIYVISSEGFEPDEKSPNYPQEISRPYGRKREARNDNGLEIAPLMKGGQGGSYIWRPDESLPSGIYLVRAGIGGERGYERLSHRDVGAYSATKRIVYLK